MLKLVDSSVNNGRNQDSATRAGPVWCHGRRCKEFLEIVLLVIFWYTISVGLIISNKWLISETGFHSTSMLTLLHMLSSCAASNTLLALGVVPRKQVGLQLLGRVAVLAASFTMAVATCMASLAYLPASFVQAIGACGGRGITLGNCC
ncbi:hypothetical protein Vafri_15689 [Volvox africanus]|uniref:Sugar phosphate transporter domain-containing protein n=1 Tax=Volvox africanus TaxID=51714 RepID=A0A8J4BLU5_9CHLO|nr:hypothetical protein Vafri_15689 [Volvox africanus]